MWISALVMVGIAVIFLLNRDYSGVTPLRFLLVAIGSLLVGFNEELAPRGLLIVGLRARFLRADGVAVRERGKRIPLPGARIR